MRVGTLCEHIFGHFLKLGLNWDWSLAEGSTMLQQINIPIHPFPNWR